MSGGQAGAENGVLTVMCGGTAEAYAGAEPVIAAYARMCKLLGPAGSGQLTKMVNQICIAGLVQGLSEGIHFAKKAGLDVQAVIDTISKGAAQSWQMENRYKTMNDGKFDFGFAVEWMRKDLSICIAESRRNGANLPVTALVDQFYSEVEKMGGKRWDTSSLLAGCSADLWDPGQSASHMRRRISSWAFAKRPLFGKTLRVRGCGSACRETNSVNSAQRFSSRNLCEPPCPH